MSAPARRVLVLGWSSVLHGEATAGDALSMQAVARALAGAGVGVEVAWSAVMAAGVLGRRARGGDGAPGEGAPADGGLGDAGTRGRVVDLALEEADPARYSHVVWACGPLHGVAVQEVVDRFAGAVLLAVGVSVIDPADPVLARFAAVLARDAPGAPPARDLAAGPAAALVREGAPALPPVVGVYLAPGQGEYGAARRHGPVSAALGQWLDGCAAACVELDTRLDPRSWRSPSTPEAVLALMGRCDVVVSQRLHGLVLALSAGVPVLAVDPVAGGGKVSAQARAWGWPALVGAEQVLAPGAGALLDAHLAWCAGPGGARAAAARAQAPAAAAADLDALVALVTG